MKKKSVFSQIILLVVAVVVCLAVTVGAAIFVGSYDEVLFDLQNLNFANMLPVLIIGGFVSCLIITIIILFILRSLFIELKNNFDRNIKFGGKEK